LVNDHPIIDAILRGMGGAIAVLDANRHVVAVNYAYLEAVGVNTTDDVLGFQPGVPFKCLHIVGDKECGRSPACSNCGALAPVLAAQRELTTIDGAWSIPVDFGHGQVDMDFQVRAVPMQLNGVSYTLLVLRDKTQEKRREALERAFFSDISHVITGLVGLTCFFEDGHKENYPDIIKKIQLLVRRLSRELEIQRALVSGETSECTVSVEDVDLASVYSEVQSIVCHHKASFGKNITMIPQGSSLHIQTDPVLLARVLTNMVLNALEATPTNGEVSVEAQNHRSSVEFRVWNAGAIAPSAAPRVFQRFFSTKGGTGRGHGTFVMKLLGETYLGGQVSFTSSVAEGTVFRLELPKKSHFPKG
jgi:signal transduction histidine kinase